MDLPLTYIPESGFMKRGGGLPDRGCPRDWLAWHFTHVDNLKGIAAAGALLPASAVEPTVNVANKKVKDRRRTIRVIPDADYPESYVSDHVPFYIAAKSPMLYVVHRGHIYYAGGSDCLVLLGFVLGDLAASGCVWCATNQNASSSAVGFSRRLDEIGEFVDFDLLCQRDWYNTSDDPDRKSRRAAEILVRDRVDLEWVRVVLAKKPRTLEVAKQTLKDVGGIRQYHVVPRMFY